MHEEVEYERQLSVMDAWDTRLLDSVDTDASSLLPHLHFCYMDLTLDSFWFITFLLAWLYQRDFRARIRQARTNPTARMVLGWQIVELSAVSPAKRARYYVGANALRCGSL